MIYIHGSHRNLSQRDVYLTMCKKYYTSTYFNHREVMCQYTFGMEILQV